MRKKHALNEKQRRETAPEGLASTCSVLAVGLFMLTFVFQNFVIPVILNGKHPACWRSRSGRTRDPSSGCEMGTVFALP